MGAFQDGFRMGQAGYQQAQDNKQRELENERQRLLDERATTEFDNRQTDRATELDKQAQLKDLGQQLTRPNAGNYAMSKGTSGPGMRMGAPAPEQTVDPSEAVAPDAASPPISLTPQQAPTAQGQGMRMPGMAGVGPDAGMKAPAMAAPMGGYTANATPTRGAAEEILSRRALLKGDDAGYRAAQGSKRAFDFEDQYASNLKEYTGSAEQVAGTAQYLNQNSKAVTMGAPDKNGLVRISVVKPDGTAEFMKMSKQDQGRLYAAGKMMPVDPVRAIEMMGAVNKDLAAAVAAENGLVGTVASNSNDVAAKSASITHGKQALGMQGAEIATRREEAKAKADAAVGIYTEKNPNATAAEKEAVRRGVIAAVPTLDNNAPAEVKLAAAYRRAGLAKDDAEALRMATQSKADSPEKMRAEIYGKALTASMGNAEAAKKATEDAMSYLMPKAAPTVAGAFASEADAAAAVKSGKLKPGDRVTINGRTATWQ